MTYLLLDILGDAAGIHDRLLSAVDSGQHPVVVLRGTWLQWEGALELSSALLGIQCISIALCTSPPIPVVGTMPEVLLACDLRILVSSEPPSTCRNWNVCTATEVEALQWANSIDIQVRNLGLTAVACARALRIASRVDELEGLVLESNTYAMLQGSSNHRDWLERKRQ